MKQKRQYKQYSKEYKEEAVALIREQVFSGDELQLANNPKQTLYLETLC